jgi:putative phosphoserine phosphatase / 1-acylglycerol-3-phosphate O-acyltransferase
MAAGIPIVPIVIRNAEFVAARNSATINPGTVDVAVFPPISVQDWTVDALDERIAEVRQLYLDALANWPIDELPQVDVYAEKKAAVKARANPAAKAAAKKAPAKKAAAAKKAPAKKAAAKKTTTTKTTTKKAATKTAAKAKTVAKKAPAQPNPNASEVPEPTTSRPEGHT